MVVPLCQSNYDDEISYTTVFEFPSETRWPEMRQKWIQFIHQKRLDSKQMQCSCESIDITLLRACIVNR